ncbi:MAG: SPOR domain-containing protein [Limnochordaceae bacterium]|nr:SPOR domain-containing protein [Limnochordaceae bacterium]
MADGQGQPASAARGALSFVVALVVVIVVGALGGYALGRYFFDRMMQLPQPKAAAPEPERLAQQAPPVARPSDSGEAVPSTQAQGAPSRQTEPAAPPPARPAPSPPSAGTASAGGFSVQVGAFGSQANANLLADTLRREGFPAQVTTVKSSGVPYKVWVGPYPSREQAQEALRKLKPRWPDAFIP